MNGGKKFRATIEIGGSPAEAINQLATFWTV